MSKLEQYTVVHCTVLYCIVYYTVLYCIAYYTALYCIVYYSVLNCIVHRTVHYYICALYLEADFCISTIANILYVNIIITGINQRLI